MRSTNLHDQLCSDDLLSPIYILGKVFHVEKCDLADEITKSYRDRTLQNEALMALREAFADEHGGGFTFTTQGMTVGVWKREGEYFLFDSHSVDISHRLVDYQSGAAYLYKTTSIEQLATLLCGIYRNNVGPDWLQMVRVFGNPIFTRPNDAILMSFAESRRRQRPLPGALPSPLIPPVIVSLSESDNASASSQRKKPKPTPKKKTAAMKAKETAQKRLNETPEQTAERLNKNKARKSFRITAETEEEKEQRLNTDKERKSSRRNMETEEERGDRLLKMKICTTSARTSCTLQTDQRVKENKPHVTLFDYFQRDFDWDICLECSERFPGLQIKSGSCIRCLKYRGGDKVNPFSATNYMDPGEVPPVLKDLSMVEEQIIAKIHPVISVYRIKGQQLGYSGQVINFPQEVSDIANKLPRAVSTLSSILIVRQEKSSGYVDFRVRRDKVRSALEYLKVNNRYYRDIEIDVNALNDIPVDGSLIDVIPQTFTGLADDQVDKDEACEVMTTDVPNFIINEKKGQIKSVLEDDPEVVAWPKLGNEPVNEFSTVGYIAMAFPTLFPYGSADLREPRLIKVTPSDYFQHLIKYKDGRFAKHPRFRFFAMNSSLRWAALQNGKICVQKNSELQNLTAAGIKERADFFIKSVIIPKFNVRDFWYRTEFQHRGSPHIHGERTHLSKSNGHWELITKRNHELVNRHNRYITEHWRANTDVQAILSYNAVLNYIAKYASKAEPCSKTLEVLLGESLKNEEDAAKTVVQKLFIRMIAERDFSAQETAQILMSWPLYHCSRVFVTINVHKKQWVPMESTNAQATSLNSPYDVYHLRPKEQETMSLFEHASKFYKKGENWVKRRTSCIVRVFPKLRTDQGEAYFRQQVLIHVPWRSVEALSNQGSWERLYHRLVEKPNDILVLPRVEEEYENVENDDEARDVAEEWMVVAAMGPTGELGLEVEMGLREIDTNHSWADAFEKFNDPLSLPGFITLEKLKDCVENEIWEDPKVTFSNNITGRLTNVLSNAVGNVFTNAFSFGQSGSSASGPSQLTSFAAPDLSQSGGGIPAQLPPATDAQTAQIGEAEKGTVETTQNAETELTETTQNAETELTEATQNAETQLTEATQNAGTELTEATQNAGTELTEATQNAETEFTEATQNAETELTEATQNAETEFTEATQNAETELTETTQNAEAEKKESEASLVEEKHSEASLVEEKHSEASVVEEKHSEASVVEEKQSEASLVEEKESEASVVEEKQSEASLVEEKESEASLDEENK
ncbi:uncharacterized protein LOC134677816 [Cydia fagiglandana]|uniref:uncharacterized protein LOC134677816 n=1 Tax=Cydia fagiglandana TaxID=1458189 RepID=UPI002FEDF64D